MRRLLFTLTLFMMSQLLYAGGFKKYAGEFHYNGAGSRAQGMGSAFVSVANDVTAGYWNPAGLVRADGFQLQFMHAKQFINAIQYDYLGLSNRFENGTTLGLSVIRLGVDDIKDSRDALLGETIAEGLDLSRITFFNTADYAFLVSFARRMNTRIAYGANVKIIYRDYNTESALGIGFDLGGRFEPVQNLVVGAMLRDVTTTMMAWSTDEKEFITPSLRTGVSYRFDMSSLNLYLLPAMDFNVLFEGREYASQLNIGPVSLDGHFGMEIGYQDIIFLRLGYDDLERFNGGLGLSITRFGVDYAYTAYDRELGNVHRIAFHLKLDSL